MDVYRKSFWGVNDSTFRAVYSAPRRTVPLSAARLGFSVNAALPCCVAFRLLSCNVDVGLELEYKLDLKYRPEV